VGAIEWLPVSQPGELYGVPIWIGGTTRQKCVTLQDGQVQWPCVTDEDTARLMTQYLWKQTLRVIGSGRWKRLESGWKLDRFTIASFEEITTNTLAEAISELRSIDAEWKTQEDPLGTLREIRSGERPKS
jgi:hypothetical protein